MSPHRRDDDRPVEIAARPRRISASLSPARRAAEVPPRRRGVASKPAATAYRRSRSVSYTHLTLPTKA